MANPRFLVVEDDPDARSVITTMLEALDCKVVATENGEDALKILVPSHNETPTPTFDAIFLDIMLPGISGYDVLEKVRATPALDGIPVVMLTAMGRAEQFIEGYSKGADYYIAKPVTVQQLVYGLDMLFADGDGSEDGAKPVKTWDISE